MPVDMTHYLFWVVRLFLLIFIALIRFTSYFALVKPLLDESRPSQDPENQVVGA